MAVACLNSKKLISKHLPFGKNIKESVGWIVCFSLSIAGFGNEVNASVILSSSFSISERYNDNLFFTENDRKSDFTTVLSPSLNIAYTSRNFLITIGYTGSAQFHSQNTEVDGYFQSLSVDMDIPILNRQFRNLEVSVTENVSHLPELPAYSFSSPPTSTIESDDSNIEDRFNDILLEGEGIQGRRVDTFRNFAGIVFDYSWTQNFNTRASYTNVITRYSGSNLEDTEVNNVAFNANYTYRVSSRTEWTSQYGVFASLGDIDELFHKVGIGVEHQVTRLVSVNGSFGGSFVEGESPEMNLGAGISKRYRRGSLNLRYNSNIATGLGVIQGLISRQNIFGEATRTLTKRVFSYLQLGYAENKTFEDNGIDVYTYTGEAGLSIQILSWLSGSLNYSYLEQRSRNLANNLANNGIRNVVSVVLSATGPSWRIIN